MLDINTRERLEGDIEETLRGHRQAQSRLRAARETIADLAIKGEDIPASLFDEVREADWEIKFNADRLDELKNKYIQAIRNITL